VSGIDAIERFLTRATPQTWIETALANLDLLLVDHANCEKKAASTALGLIYRYTQHFALLNKLSRLAREELRHFEQVIAIMEKRQIEYCHVKAGAYAGELKKLVRTEEPFRLIDTLIVSGLIEARSCERFAKLAAHLDGDLEQFYTSLLKSEARHFRDYLALATKFAKHDISSEIERFTTRESELIQTPCQEFRFHSGPVNTE
jgi:tRNA 2-(methylsulfanyl)-N6-isopentenyladenosine37 hydroxylase